MESGQLIQNEKEIRDTLENQFVSVFSLPTLRLDENIEEHGMQNRLEDIEFNPTDISKAVETIPSKASAGPDEVGAKYGGLHSSSLDESHIPDMLKIAEITPIHKGGSKKLARNYRAGPCH